MNDDSRDHLLRISVRHQQSIIKHLLDIQQKNEQRNEASAKFLSNLECFCVNYGNSGKVSLDRCWIDVAEEQNYVALSYTWSPSEYEKSAKGRYLVQDRKQKNHYGSPVRNCVLDRTTKYMKHMGVQLLWIDRHSIPQQTYKKDLYDKKVAALRSMDWVYKKSRYPVALLGRPIDKECELELLCQILTGKFAKGVRRGVSSDQGERDALILLYQITSDLWWQRAWTFQENYKGGKEMTLLISHPPLLEELKRKCRVFGSVLGELCIKSTCLFENATGLCLGLKSRGDMTPGVEEMIECILSKAGRYKELLPKSNPMDPAIIADIEKRGVKEPWDRLSIVANCCDYPVRLNERYLQQSGCSLSLSMLAMCLLNGLILYNGFSKNKSVSNMCFSEFLEMQCFNKFCSPPGALSLTFNKGCRFINVELNETGIGTEGHIWELSPVLDMEFDHWPSWVDKPRKDLALPAQKVLTQLSHMLRWLRQEQLADDIEAYLREKHVGSDSYQFVGEYMLMMAEAVAGAIEEGKALRLGRLWNPEGHTTPYTAIFIWEGAYKKGSDNRPAFAFTASQPKEIGTDGYYVNDTDRHVSLEVHFVKNQGNSDIPYLYTKRWLLGLCFFPGCRREKVIFPWPQALRDIRPDM